MCAARTVVDVALVGLSDLPVSVRWQFASDPELTDAVCAVPGTVPTTVLSWEGHVASPVQSPSVLTCILNGLWWIGGGGAVAQVAEMWDVPWTALKVVSDHGEDDRLRMLAMIAKRPYNGALK